MNNINVEIDFDKAPEDLTLLEFIVLCIIATDKDVIPKLIDDRLHSELEDDFHTTLGKLEELLYIKLSGDEIELRKKTTDLFPENKGVEFEEFWTKYHAITGKRPSDKEPSKKYWRRMTAKEKNKAIDDEQLKAYKEFVIREQGGHFYKARTYLSNKNYNDEFKSVSNVKGSGIFTLTGKD